MVESIKEWEDRTRGSLEISLAELKMIHQLLLMTMDFAHVIEAKYPEELKALREKCSILRDDLVRDMNHKRTLLAKADG